MRRAATSPGETTAASGWQEDLKAAEEVRILLVERRKAENAAPK